MSDTSTKKDLPLAKLQGIYRKTSMAWQNNYALLQKCQRKSYSNYRASPGNNYVKKCPDFSGLFIYRRNQSFKIVLLFEFSTSII
jgi:hypothetical protein